MGEMADPKNGNLTIVNGDIMMMISRDNMEIRCGDDGRVENNCVLEGGFLQVLLQPNLEGEQIPVGTSPRVDNATVRGMTFTGEIVVDPFVGGSSVVVSHPGQNIQFIYILEYV